MQETAPNTHPRQEDDDHPEHGKGPRAAPRSGALLSSLHFRMALAILIIACALAVVWLLPQGRSLIRSAGTANTICIEGRCAKTIPLPPPSALPGRLIRPDAKPIAPEDARALNAAVPFLAGKLVPARPFLFVGAPESRQRAMDCLAAAGLYEAGVTENDQRAVMQVVLNRVRHPAFPHTICGVVFEGSDRASGCQFTFTCDGALARTYEDLSWSRARQLAEKMLDGLIDSRVGWATHYHTDWVYPYWSPSLDKLSALGTHLFFRWRGYWGTGGAFTAAYAGQEPRIVKLSTPSMSGAAQDIILASAPLPLGTDDLPNPRPIADAPLPAGMSSESLEGHRLKLVHPDGGGYGLLLRTGATTDSIATVALRLCFNQPFCKVMGWLTEADLPRGFPVPPQSMANLRFLYVRDPAAPRATTQFDCTRFTRPKKDQCL